MDDQYEWGVTNVGEDVRFRLWAPAAQSVQLDIDGRILHMEQVQGGFWERKLARPASATSYLYVIDGERRPDPASRGQLADVHGPSLYFPPDTFTWHDADWRGRPWEETVLFEFHVGAFTPQGTFRAAAAELARLAEIGITAVELMPLAQFPGKRGWGYDGLLHYAPHSQYGSPDDLKYFVDQAHALGLMVFLDVVYNHFGPEGNYLGAYAPNFFRSDLDTPWGAAIDYREQAVRDYFRQNALYWLREFHLDGLRLDAVDQIRDDRPHILEEISGAVRSAFPTRLVHLVVENPVNAKELIAPYQQGKPWYRADWNDDFHHAMHVVSTGEDGGFYSGFAERPWDAVRKSLAQGYVFPPKPWFDDPMFDVDRIGPASYVHFLQNHDQIGNRGLGDRLTRQLQQDHLKLWTTILLLSPQIPLLFMGEEAASEREFFFFCDYEGELAQAIKRNRPKEAANFGGLPAGYGDVDIPDPNDIKTLERSTLEVDYGDAPSAVEWAGFIKQMLALRRSHIQPLLTETEGVGMAHETTDGILAIDWTFNARTLSLRANFTEDFQGIPPAPGNILYSSNPLEELSIEAQLPPRTVAFALA